MVLIRLIRPGQKSIQSDHRSFTWRGSYYEMNSQNEV